MPLDLSPVTSILQAFELGYNQRKEAERLQFEKLFRGKQLEQQDKQFQARMKQAESQFKATQEFRKSQIDQAQAELDYHKAVEEARAKREASKMKLDWLRDYSEGKVAFPRGDYTGTGEEISDVSAEIPDLFSPVEGVNIRRFELPEVYGKKEQQEDILKRMEASAIARDELQAKRLSEQAEQHRLDRINDMQMLEKRLAAQAELAERKQNKSSMDIRIMPYVQGELGVKGDATVRELGNAFKSHVWDDGSTGYTPVSEDSIKRFRTVQMEKTVVEMSIKYANALRNNDISTALEISFRIKSIIPSLKDITGAKALGVLSRQDLEMLDQNLPSFKREIIQRVASGLGLPKGVYEQIKSNWNMNAAKSLYNKYKNGLKTMTYGWASGQLDAFNNKFNFTLDNLPDDLQAEMELR